MEQRTMVSERELNAWMTKELGKLGIRNGSQIFMMHRLDDPDENGCNWSAEVFVSPGLNTVAVKRLVVDPAAADIVQRARAMFNVRTP